MTFTFMELVTIGSVCIALLGFCFTVIKFFDKAVHKRIDEVKTDLEAEVKHIKDNYVNKDNVNQVMNQIKDIVADVKADQHRMATRMDDFVKWLMQLQANKAGSDKP